MSARGRGGGRGRGYTPPTGAALYLKRSAQECGLDDRNLRSLQDITTPALYPDITWHSNGTLWRNDNTNNDKNEQDDDDDHNDGNVPSTTTTTTTKQLASSTLYLIQKGRDTRTHMQAHYQIGEKQEQDVLRYRNSVQQPSKTKQLSFLGGVGGGVPTYIPQELRMPIPKVKSSRGILAMNSNKKRDSRLTMKELEELEQQKRLQGGTTATATAVKTEAEGGDAEDAGSIGEREEESEDDELADYTMNYYESEGDESVGGGDGDGEPTF